MISSTAYEERIAAILRELGIPTAYGSDRRMPLRPEAAELVSVGHDLYGREQKLAPPAAGSWRTLRSAAEREGVELLLVSAFRSVDYQKQIWLRKLAAGEPVAQILRVNAAPGYSEHHTGRALDLTTAGCEPLTEAFERTAAFAWLRERARDFDFAMTYPRNNRFGIAFEPWHWAAM